MTRRKAKTTQIQARRLSLDRQHLGTPMHGVPGSRDGVPVLPSDYNTRSPKVTVVIPALNEARNLPHVFAKLPDGLHEVIVVDGNSVDDTVATARRLRPNVRIVIQNRSGKGNALACGFAAATGDIIVMVDADGSADAAEIPRFVQALLDGADFAKGSRFANGGGSSDITRLRRLGNHMLSGLVNLLCQTRYSDLCYGYNAFWRYHVPVFGLDAKTDIPAGSGTRLWGDGFEVETLINIRIAQAKLRITEVASYEHSRIHGVSNLNAVSDGWRVLRTILAERYYYGRRIAAGKRASKDLLRRQGEGHADPLQTPLNSPSVIKISRLHRGP
jgi:glycosyltransferase involved in cell wall biosynthesis